MFWKNGKLYGRATINGIRQKKCLDTDDAAVAKIRLADWLKIAQADNYHPDGPKTFMQVLEAWKTFMIGKVDGDRWRGEVGRDTFKRYCVSLAQLAPWVEYKKFSEINKALIAEIIDARKKEVSNATIKRDLVALSSVIQFGVDRDWREDNPCAPLMKRIKERRDPLVEPRDEDIQFAVQHSRGMWPHLIKAALVTGIREAALVTLQRDAINHARKEITVVDKGRKLRTVDLKPMDGYAVFAAIPAFAGKPWVFWRSADKRARSDNVRRGSKRGVAHAGDRIEDPSQEFAREIKRVAAMADERGIEFRPFTFHALRHKHAIEYLRAGGNLYDLQLRLGHSTIKQTEEYLKFLTPEQQRGATHGERDLDRRVG